MSSTTLAWCGSLKTVFPLSFLVMFTSRRTVLKYLILVEVKAARNGEIERLDTICLFLWKKTPERGLFGMNGGNLIIEAMHF